MPVNNSPAPLPVTARVDEVALVKLARLEKRLVELAVVENKLVVVAEVPVALTKVKFWRVEEAVAKILAKVPSEVEVRLVKVPVVEKKSVVVALVPVALEKENLVKEPVGPETVAEVRVELANVPPSVKALITEERRPESESDWRITVGLVSATSISSRRMVVFTGKV